MYRVATVVNENEVSHSRYADSVGTLSSALRTCNQDGAKGNAYHFVAFDKFNVHRLFAPGDNNLAGFDALFIATNALGRNERVHEVLSENRSALEAFLNLNKGIFVSSQKKLSNGSLDTAEYNTVSFLPETYDYYVFDRPEQHSSAGTINVTETHGLVAYPYRVTESVIATHCDSNHFIAHRYRSLILPKHPHAYDTVLADQKSPPVSHKDLAPLTSDRKVLLCSKYNQRIVISTMALDWANHSELLCNILTYITEDQPRTFFVKKDIERGQSSILDSYILRANIANIPYRVITPADVASQTAPDGAAYVFSPAWESSDIEALYTALLKSHKAYFSMYHMSNTSASSGRAHKVIKYSNFSSIDLMKDAVVAKILSGYLSTRWNRSVWTYHYVVTLLELFDTDAMSVAKRVYEELSSHFAKTDGATQRKDLIGSYDNVFNATCQQLEVLRFFRGRYGDRVSEGSPYPIDEVISKAEDWLYDAIERGAVFDQDVCYALLYLLETDQFDGLDQPLKVRLLGLLTQLLSQILEETVSSRIFDRSSVDLCRVHRTLCALWPHKVLSAEKIDLYLNRIEAVLEGRQDIYGHWKNVSETAEITGLLLDGYDTRQRMDLSSSRVPGMISKAVTALHSAFDVDTQMWGGDLGTTAKAMYAIGAYDRRFIFAINDFIQDLRNKHETGTGPLGGGRTERLSAFYSEIDALENQVDSLTKEVANAEGTGAVLRRRLSRAWHVQLASIGIILSLLTVLGVLSTVLYVNHPSVLSAILRDWKFGFALGIVGLALSLLGMLYDVATGKRPRS